jgi:serine/threonine protein phosphatase PrpC
MFRAAETTCKTDTGRQRRDNEDSAFARAPVFVVADGMGGAQAGEVASRLAIEAFEPGLPDEGSPEERLAQRVREANHRIYERSRADHDRAGMGTTLTAAYLDHGSVSIAHVGDSRAYMFRDGVLRRLTQDHSLVDELVRRGKLTEAQAAEHPQRSIITRALGPEPEVEVDTWTYPARAGDVLLLCSDGLTSMISEERVAEILNAADTLDRAADDLIAEANEAGGRDNITVVLFRVEDVGGAEDTEQATMVTGPEARSTTIVSEPDREALRGPTSAVAVAPPPTQTVRAPLARKQGPAARSAPPTDTLRQPPRYAKPLAALIAVVIVLAIVGAGGYLATRQLYFIGTNPQGIVTIYRGLPYDLPAGVHLYETFYVSGVPATLVPPDRRSNIFSNNLRSESDATKLVRELELGQLSG